MNLKIKLLLPLACLLIACGEDIVPKPKAMLRLSYEDAAYKNLNKECPFSFEKNELAQIRDKKDCSFNLEYTKMKATIFITYKKVENNLDSLLIDAQKLTFEHVVKADDIYEYPVVNDTDRVYGMMYRVRGNAASQTQFYVTDSTEHFLTGSLYFYAKPNYDSILPAADYLENDIRKILESIKWKE